MRLASVDIPLPVSAAMTGALLGFLIFVFAIIKNLAGDDSTFWACIGVGLATVIAVGAWQPIQESGGLETLKASSRAASSSSATANEAAPPAAAPPAATRCRRPRPRLPRRLLRPDAVEPAEPGEQRDREL